MNGFAIRKKNLWFLLAGLLLMILGYVLMAGGGSDDPNVFNYEMFSFRRLVIAPVLIIAGIIVEIYGILLKPKDKGEKE